MEQVEDCASRLLQLIKRFIDELRIVRSRKEVPSSSSFRKKGQVSPTTVEPYNNYGEIYRDFHTLSVQVHELGLDVQEAFSKIDSVEAKEAIQWIQESVTNHAPFVESGDWSHHPMIWNFVVFNVLQPLLRNLIICYTVLDAEPAATITMEGKQPEQRKQKPKPPPGMLSMQNYTDVAILLEFTVCGSILPMLDTNVLPSINNRLQSLPRSLRGRAPMTAMEYAFSHRHTSTCEKGQQERCEELLSSATLIGSVVLLDRFRPMLLPRHLADIYAAFLQTEEFSHTVNSHERIGMRVPEPMVHQLQSILFDADGLMRNCPNLAARAFQDLLLQGRKGPVWLRKRVSILLNHLSTTRLDSVVDVFVLAASQDKSAAALRLAKALTAVPSDNPSNTRNNSGQHKYYTELCNQLLLVLDFSMKQINKKFDVAKTHFVWMTLDQLPDSIIEETFFAALTKPFHEIAVADLPPTETDDKRGSIHQAIRRIEKLLTTVPPGINRSRFCRLVLLKPLKDFCLEQILIGTDITILGLLLRLYSAPVVLKTSVKVDALRVLRLTVEFLTLTTFENLGGKRLDGASIAAISIFYSLLPTKWDLASMGFKFSTADIDHSSEKDALCEVTVFRQEPSNERDINELMNNVQHYAENAFREVIVPLWTHNEKATDVQSDASALQNLPSFLLEFLLILYLRFGDRDSSKHPTVQSSLLLTVMAVTPILCEVSPMESLLMGNGGRLRLLSLTRIVFESLSKFQYLHGSKESNMNEARSRGAFQNAEDFVAQFLNWNWRRGDDGFLYPPMNNSSILEFGTSLAAILLNLLTCILELGSGKRSIEEEKDILDLIPFLKKLAEVDSVPREGIDPGLWAEINEAASHILVLIALRNHGEGNARTTYIETESNSESNLFTHAQRDLQSDQAPLRARGVASLRQIIESRRTESQPITKTLVQVIPDSYDENNEPGDASLEEKIFALLIAALADDESYVFLGAIQAIAMLSSSSYFFLKILEGISIGSFSMLGQRHSLQMNQRAKLTEAVISVLRRSPSMVHDHASTVFDVLLYGKTQAKSTTNIDAMEIQRRTKSFFEYNEYLESEDDVARWAEKKIRLNTGGPLFLVEEPDLIRAAFLNLAAETVELASTSLSARFCTGLMDCCIIALTLESARPICRSAALLAYSLYHAVVRDMEEICNSMSESSMVSSPFTIAMVKHREEILEGALHRYRSSNGSGDGRFTDAATIARCEEALSMRDRASGGGMFALAHLALQQASQDNEFLVRLVSSS